MAARENQGYVIGIIVLAVLAVMLLVTTVFSTMKAYENYDKKIAAEENATFQQALADANTAKANMLAACLGVEGIAATEITTYRDQITSFKRNVDSSKAGEIQQIADSAQAIYDTYKKDMAFNSAITDDGEGTVDADMTYKGTVDKMASALNASNANAFDKNKEAKRIERDAQQKIATITNTLDERTKALAQTEQDLSDEKQRNAAKENDLSNLAKSLQDAMDDQRAEFDDQKDGLEKTIADTNENMKFVAKQNAALKAKVNEYEREVFDLADGEIVRVSDSSDTVFIDLGRLDGLRANLTFAVYDQTANDFEKDRHKAMIEVTEILGPHLAKARVTFEDPKNPILTKDQVLSATFDRGDSVTIALGGFFDLDGDGLSDLEKLKRMIVRNGGSVVASHDEDGNITGEIDSTTRFFVLGPSPRAGAQNVVKAMGAMKEQAEGNAVDIIDIRKLLNWMGVARNARIERMDSRIGESTGFQPRSPAPASGSGTR
jgi:hypothetical protein